MIKRGRTASRNGAEPEIPEECWPFTRMSLCRSEPLLNNARSVSAPLSDMNKTNVPGAMDNRITNA